MQKNVHTVSKEIIINDNVSRETYNEKQINLVDKINELKEIRINNILQKNSFTIVFGKAVFLLLFCFR